MQRQGHGLITSPWGLLWSSLSLILPQSSALVHRLSVYLYQNASDRIRTRALLCHAFHHALHDRFHKARDLILMSHLQETINQTDTPVKVLYNRTMVQLGLAAFRHGTNGDRLSEWQAGLGLGVEVRARARVGLGLGQVRARVGLGPWQNHVLESFRCQRSVAAHISGHSHSLLLDALPAFLCPPHPLLRPRPRPFFVAPAPLSFAQPPRPPSCSPYPPAGLTRETQNALLEVFTSGKIKELLAQGIMNPRYGEKDPEQEKLERQRQVPFHMHINYDLLEAVYYTSAMIQEVPNLASESYDPRKRPISKPFRRLLEINKQQLFSAPPENTRDHIAHATKAMLAGDWRKCKETIFAIKIWDLIQDKDKIFEMIGRKIQEAHGRLLLLLVRGVGSAPGVGASSICRIACRS